MSVPADDLKSRSFCNRSEVRGVPEPEFASDDAPGHRAEANQPTPASDQFEAGEISAPHA
jgi:hypothetical protein